MSLALRKHDIVIEPYAPSDAAAFKALNMAWVSHFFVVEPFDEEVLSRPEQYILSPGGAILMARDKASGEAVGVGALLPLAQEEDGAPIFEVSKMAVHPPYQGYGIGRRILQGLVEAARQKGARRAIIYSNRMLENAIHLYYSEGFVEVPTDDAVTQRYARCNITLERVIDAALPPSGR